MFQVIDILTCINTKHLPHTVEVDITSVVMSLLAVQSDYRVQYVGFNLQPH